MDRSAGTDGVSGPVISVRVFDWTGQLVPGLSLLVVDEAGTPLGAGRTDDDGLVELRARADTTASVVVDPERRVDGERVPFAKIELGAGAGVLDFYPADLVLPKPKTPDEPPLVEPKSIDVLELDRRAKEIVETVNRDAARRHLRNSTSIVQNRLAALERISGLAAGNPAPKIPVELTDPTKRDASLGTLWSTCVRDGLFASLRLETESVAAQRGRADQRQEPVESPKSRAVPAKEGRSWRFLTS